MFKVLRFVVALFVCLVALILPYRLRVYWFLAVSETVHLPFKVFGKLAQFILRQLDMENLYEKK